MTSPEFVPRVFRSDNGSVAVQTASQDYSIALLATEDAKLGLWFGAVCTEEWLRHNSVIRFVELVSKEERGDG